MKTFKNVFIIVFPLLLLLVIVQRGNDRHVTLRDTWNYVSNIYNLNVQEFKETLVEDFSVFSNMSFALPTKEEYNSNDLLSNIWLTIKWFGNCIYQVIIAGFVILSCLFNTARLLLKTLLLPINIIYYIGGYSFII